MSYKGLHVMTELRFIGVEDNHLIVSGDDGRQFRILIDAALRDAVRPKPQERRAAPKVAPREIQQLMRAGHTIEEIVSLTGAERADVERFEAPIRAERDYMVEQARSVPVRVRADLDPMGNEGATFGSVLDERLETISARDIVWDSWKDPETGWHIKLSFTVDSLEREAIWSFEPRSRALAPSNDHATTLSQQGELDSLAAPTLRAVQHEGEAATPIERSTARPVASEGAPVRDIPRHPTAPAPRVPGNETADLLEALRRRRGEREPLHLHESELEAEYDEQYPAPGVPQPHRPPIAFTPRQGGEREESGIDDPGALPAPNRTSGMTGGVDRIRRGSHGTSSVPRGPRIVDVPLHGFDEVNEQEESAPKARPTTSRKQERDTKASTSSDSAAPSTSETPARGRNTTASLGKKRSRKAMPSWDEIVFGTKRDEE